VAKDLDFKTTELKDPYDFDLLWTDIPINPCQVTALKPYQKINHWPGMGCLYRKNQLAKHLIKMLKNNPEKYDFFPRTWCLPIDAQDFLK
jgi:tubulin polyglutamylase TTLL6/13